MENEIIIPREKEEAIKADLATLQKDAQNLAVKTDEDLTSASAFLAQVKTRINRLKDIKDELVKPMKQAVRHADNWFKVQVEPFTILERQVKDAIGDYITQKEKEATTLAKQGNELIERPKASVCTEFGRVSSSKVWAWEVTDGTKVPKKYLAVNSAAVTDAVRNGERKIPGIKIYQKTQVKVMT